MHSTIFVSSVKHHLEEAYSLERITIANLDSSIAFKSSGAMNVPRLSFSSSLKVDMPLRFKALYRWSVNFVRVSSPLKLRNTSYLHPREEEEDGDDDGIIKAMKEWMCNELSLV